MDSSEAVRAVDDECAPLLSDRESADPDLRGKSHRSAELWLLLKYSLPLVATYLLQYSFFVIIAIVAGHLGPDDLAAASVGVTTMDVVGLAIFEGMATALDTLCTQAYGSGNLVGVGLHVQRMLLLMAAVTVPVGAFWVCSPWILPAVVRQHGLAVRAGSFLRASLVGLPGYAAFEAGKRFLQTQGDCNAGMLVLIICAPVNALLSWFLAFRLGMGLEGAALGAALSNDLRAVLLLVYIVSPLGKWSHVCWGGFSRDALQKWRPMLSLSGAGAVLVLAEWGSFEILTLSTSYISTKHIAAQNVLTTSTVVVWHIPFAASVAMSTRVGHLIGGGRLGTARRATALYAAVFLCIGLLDASILFLLRHRIPLIFSNDPEIREISARSTLTVAVYQIVDALNCGSNGLMRGLGRQDVAARIVLVVQYALAVPLALWLELGRPNMELDGVWIGFATGLASAVSLECLYMKVTKWQDCVDRAKSREDI